MDGVSTVNNNIKKRPECKMTFSLVLILGKNLTAIMESGQLVPLVR